MVTIPTPRFSEANAEAAHADWGFNCGPAAVAAISGLTIAELRPHLGDFESKRYTNPTLMFAILKSAGIRYTLNKGLRPGTTRWPNYGLARIQWEGPWMNGGVPIAARYRHTHWVGCCATDAADIGIFDVNCMNNGTGWVALRFWEQLIVPSILRSCHPNANGKWHVTHAIEVQR